MTMERYGDPGSVVDEAINRLKDRIGGGDLAPGSQLLLRRRSRRISICRDCRCGRRCARWSWPASSKSGGHRDIRHRPEA
jgi:hypothetical protein